MLVSVVATLLVLTGAAQDDKPDPREKLETAVVEAIRLLEAKETLTFLKQFVHPDDLNKVIEGGKTLEKLAEQFSAKKSSRLVAFLKEIRDKQPELSEDGNQAVFKVETKTAPGGKVVFQKSGKLWYIRN